MDDGDWRRNLKMRATGASVQFGLQAVQLLCQATFADSSGRMKDEAFVGSLLPFLQIASA